MRSDFTPRGFPGGSTGKEPACNMGDLGSIPGLGRCPGEGKGCPLQSSGLENSMDSMVHGVAKSRTQWSDFYSHLASRGQLVISRAIFIVTTGEGLLTFVGKGRECC